MNGDSSIMGDKSRVYKLVRGNCKKNRSVTDLGARIERLDRNSHSRELIVKQ